MSDPVSATTNGFAIDSAPLWSGKVGIYATA